MAQSEAGKTQYVYDYMLSHSDLKVREEALADFLQNEQVQNKLLNLTTYWARSRLKNDVEDILQDAILVLIKKVLEGSYDANKANIYTYANGIIRNITRRYSDEVEKAKETSLDEITIKCMGYLRLVILTAPIH